MVLSSNHLVFAITAILVRLPQISSTRFSILLVQFEIFYSSSVSCREISQQCITESFSELGNILIREHFEEDQNKRKIAKNISQSHHITIEFRLPFCAYYKKPNNGVIVKSSNMYHLKSL